MSLILTSQKRTQCKSDEGGSHDLLWFILSDIRGDRCCEDVKEWLPDRLTATSVYISGVLLTTTSIIILPLAPTKLLPPRVYVNCAIDVLKVFRESHII